MTAANAVPVQRLRAKHTQTARTGYREDAGYGGARWKRFAVKLGPDLRGPWGRGDGGIGAAPS